MWENVEFDWRAVGNGIITSSHIVSLWLKQGIVSFLFIDNFNF